MSDFRKIWNKIGGLYAIKDYGRKNLLLYMLCEMLLNGKSRKSLEIIRLGTEKKTLDKLRKKYKKFIDNYFWNDTLPIVHEKIVWICWLQGLDEAPDIVTKCVKSIDFKEYKKVILTDENFQKYIRLPDYIVEKYRAGKITKTHFSDILRVELLCQYGGTWIDATVWCSDSNLPSYMLESNLFMFQTLKPGRDGSSLNVSSWFITASSNNPILMLTRDLLRNYWKKEERLIDYFLLHYFIELSIEHYDEEWKHVVPNTNELPHSLLLNLFEQFDENWWNGVMESTKIHKLSYKFSDEELKIEGTNYKHFINQ